MAMQISSVSESQKMRKNENKIRPSRSIRTPLLVSSFFYPLIFALPSTMARVAHSRRRKGMAPLLYANVRRRLESRSKEQRRTAALIGHMRTAALSEDLSLELTRQLEIVADLANKHNVKQAKIKKELMHHRRSRKSAVNLWNVHFHAVGEEVNGGMWYYSCISYFLLIYYCLSPSERPKKVQGRGLGNNKGLL